MSAPFPLRPDFDAALLRRLARQSRDPDQTRRLLAFAEIHERVALAGLMLQGEVTISVADHARHDTMGAIAREVLATAGHMTAAD